MSYTRFQSHLIFSTKQRQPWLYADTMPRLVHYIGGIIRGLGGTLIEGNGPEDHIHLAAILPATRAPSDVLRDVKALSSKWLHQTFPSLHGFGWQDGYAGFSVSETVMSKVVDYIRKQQEHHRRMTFEEEIARLLRQHGIEFDERYI
ncbi:MAG TPA: transposase [Thermoguttaceae bacterium]|nr:transposase [Thermoguttaceae bacterium]